MEENKRIKMKKIYIISAIVVALLIGALIISSSTKKEEPGFSKSLKNILDEQKELNRQIDLMRDTADRLRNSQ